MLTRELIGRLPKAELHTHLDAALRPETMIELADAAGFALPTRDPVQLRRFMRVDNAANLEDYLQRFEYTIPLLQSAEAIERVSYEMVEDAARDRIRYLEVRYCPWLSRRQGLSMERALEAELAGLARGERDFGVVTRVINCSLRHYDPAVSLEIARLSVAYRDRGVVAFDLAGGEAGRPRGCARGRLRRRAGGQPRHHGARGRGRGRRIHRRRDPPMPCASHRPRHQAPRGSRAARLRARPAHPDRDQRHQQRADPRGHPAPRITRCGSTSTKGWPSPSAPTAGSCAASR